jgi:hypothetical protein
VIDAQKSEQRDIRQGSDPKERAAIWPLGERYSARRAIGRTSSRAEFDHDSVAPVDGIRTDGKVDRP